MGVALNTLFKGCFFRLSCGGVAEGGGSELYGSFAVGAVATTRQYARSPSLGARGTSESEGPPGGGDARLCRRLAFGGVLHSSYALVATQEDTKLPSWQCQVLNLYAIHYPRRYVLLSTV